MKIGQSRFLLKCVSCVVCIFFLLTLVEVVVLFEITLLVLIDFGKIPFNAIEKNTYHMVYPCILTNMWKIVEVFLFLHCDLFGFNISFFVYCCYYQVCSSSKYDPALFHSYQHCAFSNFIFTVFHI